LPRQDRDRRPPSWRRHGMVRVTRVRAVRPREPVVAVAADLSKYLDKAYEDKTLEEVLAAPVSALAGVTDADGELLQKAFNIKTVGDLGRNKYFTWAHALVALSS
jgi:hypothetical protein